MESRKKKEDKKRSAENKLNEEKNKRRKGTKDYGHDYHPAPKTEDIKGLGELKEGGQKLQSKVVEVSVPDGMEIRGVKFMSGTLSMVSLRAIEPVMVSILVHLTLKPVSS